MDVILTRLVASYCMVLFFFDETRSVCSRSVSVFSRNATTTRRASFPCHKMPGAPPALEKTV